MSHLKISLLGPSQITIDGNPLKIPTFRALPLLSYLAVTEVGHSRENLANLLWSDSNPAQALAALRTTLWRIKQAGMEDWISLENNEISLNYHKSIEVDVLDFIAKINKCTTHGHSPSQICLFCIPALTEAVISYRGDFMAGFNLSKAPVFDEWRVQEGETLQALYMNALERLVKGHRTFGDFNLAIQYARTLLRQDRYNETTQFDLLQLYSITGQRAAALNQYKRYKEMLFRELGIQPSVEISELYKQILGGRAIPAVTQKVKTPIFLIADIEKASLLWAKASVNKTNLLTTYHNIIKDTSKRFGGTILQKFEDKITVLFENGQPLHCAVTIHLKVKKADWGSMGYPGIRMVLYSSATNDERNNDFSMITRAASNLLSSSWGGQILFTEQTLQLLDQPPGSKIKDLGLHTLKDINQPVHVFGLLHPHVPEIEYQSLQSGSPYSVNFPNLTPAFVGRETELKELSSLIESPENRIISLVGPGGIGKTRLAVQFAAQVASRFSDGVYFISLASIQDPDLIPIVLADTLKFSFYGPKNHVEQLASYIHRMNLLLVFDNFEHLRIEGSKFLAFLLAQTHHLQIIVTSRERLNLISETILEVYGLPVPASDKIENGESYSAVRLFMQNAQRISPRFSYPYNATDIIRICQLVNGIPLGIILASSWVRVYTCSQIAEEIKNNIDFLTSTAPDLPPRHRSLRAVFDNSWELLSSQERLILQRLSIFPIAFTPQTAQQICAASPEILAAFLDKSLLISQKDRYEMLDIFRQYTLGKLVSNTEEINTTTQKFIEYYADFCVQKNYMFNSSNQRQALDEMISEFDNIRTAWAMMIDSGRWDLISNIKLSILTYHVMVDNFVQGREFFRSALSKLESLNDPALDLVHAQMMQLGAWMAIKNGFITEGLQLLKICLETFQLHNSAWDIIMTMMFLADASRLSGSPQRGRQYIDDALQLIHKIELPDTNIFIAITAHCQSILGLILVEMGDFAQAESNLKSSLAAHQKIGTYFGAITPLLGLGKLAYIQGEFFQSRDLYLQALETATKIYEQRGMAIIHNNLGAVYEDIASPAESYHHVLTALKHCKETGDRRLTAVIMNNLAYHQLRYLKFPSEAIRTYHESIEIFSDLGDLRGVTYSYYDLSKAYLQVGLLEEARNYCSNALQTAMTLDSTSLILHALHGFAYLHQHLGELERALSICYLLENHPQIESDTRKRVIVTRVELETKLPAEIVDAIRNKAETTRLQDVIDQVLTEKRH